jgi:hypothetical protein
MGWIEIKIAGDVRWISPRVNAPSLFINFNIFLDKSFDKNFDSKRIYDWYRLLSISIKLIFSISLLVI